MWILIINNNATSARLINTISKWIKRSFIRAYFIPRNVSWHVFSAPWINADINQRRFSNQIFKGEEIIADWIPSSFRCIVINADRDPWLFYLGSKKTRVLEKEFELKVFINNIICFSLSEWVYIIFIILACLPKGFRYSYCSPSIQHHLFPFGRFEKLVFLSHDIGMRGYHLNNI